MSSTARADTRLSSISLVSAINLYLHFRDSGDDPRDPKSSAFCWT